MNTIEVLIAARKLIEQPKDWAQGTKVNLSGVPTCASVAMDLASRNQGTDRPNYDRWSDACNAFQTAIDGEANIPAWNDSHTHQEVLDAFDRAIAAHTPQMETK